MKPGRPREGFTLLELMVVLTLLAVTAAAAVPAFLGDRAMSAERRTAVSLAETLVRTRDAARESGASATLVLSPSDGRYWITTRDSSTTGVVPMDAGVLLTGATAARLQCDFEPTGRATPCTITIRGERAVAVRVDPWTGEIRVGDDRAS